MPYNINKLFSAAESNDIEKIQEYLESGGDINVRDSMNRTLLLALMSEDGFDKDFALDLCKRGIELSGTTDIGSDFLYFSATVIHCAYLNCYNDKRIFNYLLTRKDVDLNLTCDDGYDSSTIHYVTTRSPTGNLRQYNDGYGVEHATVLHYAVLNGDLDAVKRLCETGRVNINATANLIHNRHLQEDLDPTVDPHIAKGIERLSLVWICRDYVNVTRVKNVTPLHLAAKGGHRLMCDYLLSKGADIEALDSSGASAKEYLKQIISDKEYEVSRGNGYYEAVTTDDLKIITEQFTQVDLAQKIKKKKYKPRLILGDGKMNYTQAVIQKHLKDKPRLAGSIVTSEYMKKNELVALHGATFTKTLEFLKKSGATVLFGLDARQINNNEALTQTHFKRIHFNFPHDKSSFHERTLPDLIAKFFLAAKDIQAINDEIHIALPQPPDLGKRKFYQSYVYDIFTASAKAGYILIKKRKFDSERYPGYTHTITGAQGSADVAKYAREYIFMKSDLSYEKIINHPIYRFGEIYRAYNSFFPTLRDIETDNDSSDYSDKEAPTPKRSKLA